MKYLKTIGLAAVAASVRMAFVGASSASATVLCKTGLTEGCAASGWDYPAGTSIELSATTSGKFVAGGITLDTCTGSTINGKTSNTGGQSVTVTAPLEALKGARVPARPLRSGMVNWKSTGSLEPTMEH